MGNHDVVGHQVNIDECDLHRLARLGINARLIVLQGLLDGEQLHFQGSVRTHGRCHALDLGFQGEWPRLLVDGVTAPEMSDGFSGIAGKGFRGFLKGFEQAHVPFIQPLVQPKSL